MNELVWIKVETTKSNDDVWFFKGQVLKAVFEGIISNQLTQGYFKLEKVYWTVTEYDADGNEKEKRLCQYGKEKLAKLSPENKKTLSLVTPIRS